MDSDKTVRNAFLDTVVRQIESGEPPVAKATYERLIAAGQSHTQALHLIAAALRSEMDRMLADAKPFDNQRYAELLAKIAPEG
ncbi:MAG TPA: hypothetical protein VEG27_04595 [Usitatibacter sp.]|nr:hypothetical protein [Usitatibacter sp.]